MINSIKWLVCIKKVYVYSCVLIMIKIHCLLEWKQGHFCPICLLEIYSLHSRGTCRIMAARPVQVPWRDLWLLPVISGTFDLHFSSGIITKCIRVLGSLPVGIQPRNNIDIMVRILMTQRHQIEFYHCQR